MHDIFRDVFIYWIFLIENNYAYLKRKHNVYAASRSIGTHNSVYTVHSPANMDTLQPVPYFTDNLICRAGHTPQLWRQSDTPTSFQCQKIPPVELRANYRIEDHFDSGGQTFLVC